MCIRDRYETKQLLVTLFSSSGPVSAALGVPGAVNMSTYQRNKMAPLALYITGNIGVATCKYRLHYEQVRYRPQLEPSRMQLMHERAMSLGEDDPLKPDYTRYIKKKEKKRRTNVDPLLHGHLNNVKYLEERDQYYAAIKLQSLYLSLIHI